jgi:hypothetical protein
MTAILLWQGKDDQVPPITLRILLHILMKTEKNEVILYPKVYTLSTELKMLMIEYLFSRQTIE